VGDPGDVEILHLPYHDFLLGLCSQIPPVELDEQSAAVHVFQEARPEGLMHPNNALDHPTGEYVVNAIPLDLHISPIPPSPFLHSYRRWKSKLAFRPGRGHGELIVRRLAG
jgi:hypothetical protein